MKHPIPFLALVLLLLGGVLAVPAHAKSVEQRLEEAQTDLEYLEDLLDDDDATNREIKTFLDLVIKSATEIEIPAKAPEGVDPDEYERNKRGWARDLEDLRDDTVDALLEALTETDLDRRTGVNQREPVNIYAGPLLGKARAFLPEASDRRRLSRRIIKKIKRMDRARHTVDADVFGGAFLALAHLGEMSSLEYLMENYLHTRKKAEEVKQLRAAMRAMAEFPSIPGNMRHELTEEMLKRYVAIEALAQQSSTDVSAIAAKRFWDSVRTDAIPLLQHVTGYPRGENGVALASMGAFEDWFRDHDNSKKEPWTKPIEAKAKE